MRGVITAGDEVRDERHTEKVVHSWRGESHIQRDFVLLVLTRCMNGLTLNPSPQNMGGDAEILCARSRPRLMPCGKKIIQSMRKITALSG